MLEALPFPNPKIESLRQLPSDPETTVVAGLHEDQPLGPTLQAIDDAGNGWLTALIDRGQVNGKSGSSYQLVIPADSGKVGGLLFLMGLGRPDRLNRTAALNASATAMRALNKQAHENIVIALAECFDDGVADALIAGVLTGVEGQAIYQNDPGTFVPERIQVLDVSPSDVQRGQSIGQAINHTRRLVNEPAAMIYPQSFCDRARDLFAATLVKVEVWDETKLSQEGCRSILAVGAGSDKPPRLLILRYMAGGDEPPLALVGKGVTFDSGGLSLKPSEGMIDMKCDMAGAASVVGAMHGLAALGVKKNVIGVCGLAENMVSGTSYKLGDVIETRSGKTIEILNTDAEGRVVLADTLDVTIQMQPAAIVDLATLTGACMVALGTDVVGVMTNHVAHCADFESAARDEGELVWQLPMFDLYDEKVKSKVADIKNVGEGRWGGAITAAKFLENFVGETPWVHLDIAGPAFADSPKPHRDAGATGVMVRSLIRWVESS